jgi:lysophospholipase L1-like esterase
MTLHIPRPLLAAALALALLLPGPARIAGAADDPELAKFHPAPAPAPGPLLLKAGDRLAICGDSITEQKMYSRIIETYLTACVPELKVTVRQFGWSGETAEGFLGRMKQDCLRFKPTIATLCYGMNDHRYTAYTDTIGNWYREKVTAIVDNFTAAGARVVLGSAGCVGKVPRWSKHPSVDDLNVNLCTLRNLDIEIAAQHGARFADVFWPMLTATYEARRRYAPTYAVPGGDGVHPGWAGHVIMAYAYLTAMGLDGDLGTITVDLDAGKATATGGHTVDGFADGTVTLTSTRYPFCATGALDQDGSQRSGMTLVPFAKALDRLTLVVKGKPAASYQVTWGETSRTYTGAELAAGVNLADDFAVNPFSAAFKKVDDAVIAKQAYETKQIKEVFHGAEGKADIEKATQRTEAEREPLAAAVAAAVVPVQHRLRIVAQ